MKIAVLLATYNGEKYLEDQLRSLLEQTVKDICIYIHDDGSTDGTGRLIDRYAKEYPNKIFVLNGSSTGGAKHNFFYLMRNVDADYLCFCDQDDVWEPNKIEIQLNRLLEVEKGDKECPCLVWTDMRVVDEKLNLIHVSFSKYANLKPDEKAIHRFWVSGKAAGCSMMINKSLQKWCCNIPYEAEEKIIMHDWFLMIIAKMFGKAEYVDQPTVLYRQHTSNVVGAQHYHKRAYIQKLIYRILSGKQFSETRKHLNMHINQCSCLRYLKDYEKSEYKNFIDGAFRFDEMSRIKKHFL